MFDTATLTWGENPHGETPTVVAHENPSVTHQIQKVVQLVDLFSVNLPSCTHSFHH